MLIEIFYPLLAALVRWAVKGNDNILEAGNDCRDNKQISATYKCTLVTPLPCNQERHGLLPV